MLAGAARIDITPIVPVGMDGMIRAHGSLGVHDPLFARCLVLANSAQLTGFHAIVSIDVCALDASTTTLLRDAVVARTGMQAENIIIAATHTHSGPATYGFFCAREDEYNNWLSGRIASVVDVAAGALQPARAAWGSAQETTISHYRRLLARDGHVVMNWEPYPPEELVGPLGVADGQVSVLRVQALSRPQQIIALRIVAPPPSVFQGGSLREALEAAGLVFGRYQIFHRLDASGQPVFSAASLREPGTFDLAGMERASFRGVALFAVLPGPLPGSDAFDALLEAARTIAGRLGGLLQDERGVALGPVRTAELRESAATFAYARATARDG